MSTHLFDDPDLDAEDYEWDVFAPDPDDETDEARALVESDEDGLDLDDSEFDWEASLVDDPDVDAATDARVEAAFDRMHDSVLRFSGEELEPEAEVGSDAGPEEPELVIVPESEVQRSEHGGTPEIGDQTRDVSEDEPELVLLPDPEEIAEPTPVAPAAEATLHEPLRLEPALGAEPEETGAERAADPFAALAAEVGLGAAAGEVEADRALDPSGGDVESTLDPWAEPALTWEDVEEADDDGATVALYDAEPGSVAPAPPVYVEGEDEPGWDDLDGSGWDPAWDAEDELDAAPVPATGWPDDPDLEAEVGVTESDAGVHPEFEESNEFEGVRGPAHARRAGSRRRVLTATVVVGCLFLVVVAAAGLTRTLRHAGPSNPPTTATTVPAATTAVQSARLQTATDDADSATTTAQAGLTALPGFPTPTNVAAVVDPYVASLRIYQTFLSGATVRASAQRAAAAATAEVRDDITFFSTIDGLPPIQLGAYLNEFSTDVTHLQTTLSTLEEDLHATSAP